jgi:two-component system NarL family response regulator
VNEKIHNPVRVLLADDHAIFRHGIRTLLEHWPGIEVLAECGDGQSALDSYLALKPDVLLLDLRMPRLDGLEVVKRVIGVDPGARILIMTTYNTDHDIGHALRAGAKGYLLKDAAPDEVHRAILQVAEGRMALTPDITAQFVQITTRAELSPRELQVMQLLAAGKPNKEIARNLSLELCTVKGHVRSVFDKFHVRNRTEAVAEATRRGIVAGA